MSHLKVLGLISFALLSAALVLGCTQTDPPTNTGSSTAQRPVADGEPDKAVPANSGVEVLHDEHEHEPGAHGGIIVSLGRDSYHVEAVFEKGGVLRLYTLGKDESRVIDIKEQTLRGYVKAAGESEAEQFTLKAEPQEGDKAGRTSLFAGKLPESVLGKSVEVTIPNIVIEGERFRLGFQSTPEQMHTEGMPAKASSGEEQTLYLTPGGKYTEADIEANGRMVASVKFKGLVASHDLKPKAGARICPITLTKANPTFTWVIGGKPYQFCCPPCIDEFVKLAKEKPDDVKEPEEYVQK